MLLIVTNKHRGDQKIPLMTHNSGHAQVVKTKSKQKWKHPYISITKGMKTLHGAHSMYDCVFSWATILIVYVIIINNWCTISMWVELVSTKAISNGKDIHSSSSVAREEMGDLLLNMCFILQSNNYDSILKCIVGWCRFIPARTSKQMGT